MKTFVCTDHDHHWPVGVASVVQAESEDAARALLDVELKKDGLQTSEVKPYTLKQLPADPVAVILRDGNY